jgi:site-specific DNA recombinase
MAAIKSKVKSFDVVVVRNVTRLGREMSDNLVAQVAMHRAGIKMYGYADGQEIRGGKALDKMMACLGNFGAEIHSETVSEDTRRGKLKTARAGKFPGGRVPFGYTVVKKMAEGKLRFDKVIVDESQADVVRRIFTLATGQGLRQIARALNAGPIRPHVKDWGATTVRNILHSKNYLGTLEYTGRLADGTTETVTITVPPIITKQQWDTAHKRMAQTRLVHHAQRGKKGQLYGSVAQDTGLDSHHLLSGFLRCGSCGGNMKLSTRSRKGGRPWLGWYCSRYYGHGNSKHEGCRGAVPYEELTHAVRSALDPEAIQQEVIRYLFSIPATDVTARETLAVDLAKAAKEVDNLADAIGQGGDLPVLVARLKAATARVGGLRAALAAQETLADQAASLDPEDLVEALRLSQEGVPDLTADRSVLRSLGVIVTVDRELKEAIIKGTVGKVVAARLGGPSSGVPLTCAWRRCRPDGRTSGR